MSTETPAVGEDGLPVVPNEPVQEGARWRFHRPSSAAVAAWFETVPLDEGLESKDFVGGVVLIPQIDKVKHTLANGGTKERHEQVFTPYVQIGTRVFYARRLAEKRSLRYVAKPLAVPRVEERTSSWFNGNMPDGLWWHVVMNGNGEAVKFLCSTWTVQLLDKDGTVMLEGQGTKQVTGLSYNGGLDENAVMKAETGAIGRALGVAGILTVGTGIATSEDMQEYVGSGAAQAIAALPPTEIPAGAQPPAETPEERTAALRSRCLALSTTVQELGAWPQFQGWWTERSKAEGWAKLEDVPAEGLPAIVAKLEAVKTEAEEAAVIS